MAKDIAKILKKDGIGVLLTDTLFGVVGSAFSKKAVSRIYELKKRDPKKPLVILISKISDLKKFGVKLKDKDVKMLNRVWPGRISIILPCKLKKFSYLHRGTDSLAFRMPKKKNLISLLNKTGPLVAPSANVENMDPATTIKEAKRYFGDKVDFYYSQGKAKKSASAIILFVDGGIKVIRKGDKKLNI